MIKRESEKTLKANETQMELVELLNDNNRANELRIAFELFDKDKDGFVSIEELGCIMMSLGCEYSEQELEDMIYEACKDTIKQISYSNFMVIMNKRGKDVDVIEEYTEAFRVFDREGNGTVNREEMKQILITLGDRITEQEVEYMLRDADINEDGLIEYKKFIRLMLFK